MEKSRGFEALISYTERGFEPTKVTLKKGQSVRFANNSGEELWIAAASTAGSPPYPGMSDCGGSTLDSCKTLQPLEFWEFTFSQSGTWHFRNNLNKERVGSVTIEVR